MDVKDNVAVPTGGAQGIGRDIVVAGFAEERFMTSTHPWVLERLAIKARDYDESIRKLRGDRAAAAVR